jgi:hypothetical protein
VINVKGTFPNTIKGSKYILKKQVLSGGRMPLHIHHRCSAMAALHYKESKQGKIYIKEIHHLSPNV